MRFPVLLSLAILGSSFAVPRAAAPAVEELFPSGGRIGTTVSVAVGGKIEPWPPGIWSSSPDLKWTVEKEKGKLTVVISTNAPAGPHLIRLYNEEGASLIRLFMVEDDVEMLDEEPNDSLSKAQRVTTLPVIINGRLEKEGDTDSFQIELQAGQWLVVSVDASSLDSPVDPVLHLFDQEGTRVAFNHDGQFLDPFLAYRAVASGNYVLQLSAFAFPPKADIRLTGGKTCVYRLNVSAGPVAHYVFPAGIRRGTSGVLRVFGWNLGTKTESVELSIDALQCGPEMDALTVVVPGAENRLRIPLGDLPEAREIEANDEASMAQPVQVPVVINGRIDSERDRDQFQFEAEKDERLQFRILSQRLGFPLDSVLFVRDRDGKQLARSDDSGKFPDPTLTWSAPAAGSYIVAIEDLIQRGGSDFVYRLEIDHPEPGFEAEVLSDALIVEPGKAAELTVNVTRQNGFDAGLAIIAEGLPDGVSSTTASVPAKGGEVKLSFVAGEDAKPGNQPIRLLAVVTNPRSPEVRVVAAILKGGNTLAGQLKVNEWKEIWLTIPPKPPKEIDKPEESKSNE